MSLSKKRPLRSAALIVTVVALPLATAAGCPNGKQPNAPKVGVVQEITPNSNACLDQGTRSVGVLYQPDGVDKNGAAWPWSLLCVTPETAGQLAIGGRVQG